MASQSMLNTGLLPVVTAYRSLRTGDLVLEGNRRLSTSKASLILLTGYQTSEWLVGRRSI